MLSNIIYETLSLYRDRSVDETFERCLRSSVIAMGTPSDYLYYIRKPNIKGEYTLKHESDVGPCEIFLVKVVESGQDKVIFKKIDLILDDNQGWTHEIEREQFHCSGLYYGLFWFILKVPLPQPVSAYINRYSEFLLNEKPK